jgi:glycosyltransferase involved in cell wall biosynthesis
METFIAPFRLRSNSKITSRLRRRSGPHPRGSMLLSAKPSHIVVVSETAAPEINGVAHTIGHLINGLRQLGYRVTLVRPSRPDLPRAAGETQSVITPGLPIPGYPELRLGLPCRTALRNRWFQDMPDLVHIVTEGPLGSSALAAAKDLGLPVTSSFHTHFEHYCGHYGLNWLSRPVDRYLRKFHNRTELTLVPTRALANQLIANGYRNVEVLGRGIDEQLFRPERRDGALRASWGLAADDLAVICVGRVAAEKNLDLVFDAFARIAKAHSRARLVIVGDGPRLASLRRAHPETIFAGMRTGPDLAAHYASADLFLFPSLTETYGNVIVEAMASGLPVVAFDRGAASEWILDRKNGMRVDPNDPCEFVYAALELAGNPSLRHQIGQQAAAQTSSAGWPRISGQFATYLDRAYQRHVRQIAYRTRLSYIVD